jgi:hypothetical protein
VVAGVCWWVVACLWLLYIHAIVARHKLRRGAAAIRTLAVAAAMAQLFAATLLIGGNWLWPETLADHLTVWSSWLTQGVAAGLASAGGLGYAMLAQDPMVIGSTPRVWIVAIWSFSMATAIVACITTANWIASTSVIAQVLAAVACMWMASGNRPDQKLSAARVAR